MKATIQFIRGVHPGIILERELKARKLPKGRFALSIQEYPQVLASVMKGRRRMNPGLALKAEAALGLEEGYFLILQAYHDVKLEKQKQHTEKPDASQLRRVLFWDTNFDTIDWQKQKRAVIRRVFERGNDREKHEIRRFYGQQAIDEVMVKHG